MKFNLNSSNSLITTSNSSKQPKEKTAEKIFGGEDSEDEDMFDDENDDEESEVEIDDDIEENNEDDIDDIFGPDSDEEKDDKPADLLEETQTKEKKKYQEMVSDDEDENEEDDDDDDDDYLQKFDENIKKNIISEYHPELNVHNYDEVDILSTVVRDNNNEIIDPLHRTLPFLTKYEKARILGERAKQLDAGATPFVTVENDVIDGYLIALKELEEKKIPFIIQRPLPNGACEFWKLKDLEIL